MEQGARHAARLFYSFRPSDEDDARKPLFVFMNGGPGFATSMGLLSWGIGPHTLREGAGLEAPAPNPARWTRFGNLLFVEERHAGFSYGIGPSTDGGSCSILDDAADHLLALLEFLAGHPHLRSSRVVLVGESYGGTRAVAMLKMLRAPELAPTEALRTALRAHFDAVFPDLAGQRVPEARVASQFGDAVLIQPLVLGDLQLAAQKELLRDHPVLSVDDPARSRHDVRMTNAEVSALFDRTLGALADPSARALLLGGKIEDVPTLAPSARPSGFREVQRWDLPSEDAADRDLTARLGALRPGDRYYSPMALSCVQPFGPAATQPWFVELLSSTRFFVTNARYDAAIHTPAIALALRTAGIPAEVEPALPGGVARPGTLAVHVPARAGQPAVEARVRLPSYESGHTVASSSSAELAADVAAWLPR